MHVNAFVVKIISNQNVMYFISMVNNPNVFISIVINNNMYYKTRENGLFRQIVIPTLKYLLLELLFHTT